jgi:hypothetical protein
MGKNYNPSTISSVGDINRGLVVETGILLGTAYMLQAQVELFKVYGKIKVLSLFGEVTTAISATATTILFNFTSTSPVIAVQPMSAASGSLSGAAVGLRASLVGSTVGTVTAITATAGISYDCALPQIIGTKSGVGTIGQLTGTANVTSGAMKFTLCYVPMEEGAYAEAIL